IRTSGEIRLSDFLLWQTGFCYVAYVPEMWPEMKLWTLVKIILRYQMEYKAILKDRQIHQKLLEAEDADNNNQEFASHKFDQFSTSSDGLEADRKERIEHTLQ